MRPSSTMLRQYEAGYCTQFKFCKHAYNSVLIVWPLIFFKKIQLVFFQFLFKYLNKQCLLKSFVYYNVINVTFQFVPYKINEILNF